MAWLIRRAPSEPPKAAIVNRSGGNPSVTRAARRSSRDLRTAATSGRTGVPVTTAWGIGVPSQPTMLARANRPSSLFAAPGTASTLTSTNGTPTTRADSAAGRLAYPPTDTTTLGRARITRRSARHDAVASPATAPRFRTRSPGARLRTIPRPGRSVTGKPRPSRAVRSWPRLDPTNSMLSRS